MILDLITLVCLSALITWVVLHHRDDRCRECGREAQVPPFDCETCISDNRRIEGDW